MKPLVEGLVLKLLWLPWLWVWRWEAPRGGAGIEMRLISQPSTTISKPLVEGLVLKS